MASDLFFHFPVHDDLGVVPGEEHPPDGQPPVEPFAEKLHRPGEEAESSEAEKFAFQGNNDFMGRREDIPGEYPELGGLSQKTQS